MGPKRELLAGEFDHITQFERRSVDLHLASLDLGEVKDVVDEHQQRVRTGAGHRRVVALLFGQRLSGEQVEHPDDAVERGADLVAHVRQELTFGAALRFGQLDPRQHDLLPLRDVVHRAEPADERPQLVADRNE